VQLSLTQEEQHRPGCQRWHILAEGNGLSSAPASKMAARRPSSAPRNAAHSPAKPPAIAIRSNAADAGVSLRETIRQ
jgi:hypothetical protein